MEDLSEIAGKVLNYLFVLLIFQTGIAQNEFFVYRVSGEPYLEVNDSIKSVKRGSVLDAGTKLTTSRNDFVEFINQEGDFFQLYETGTFTHEDLQNVPPFKDNTTMSRKMFNWIWKEMTNTMASRNNKSGVIYRGDAITGLLHPMDSVLVYGSEVRFAWEPINGKEKDYYLILRDIETNMLTAIGTPATTISIGIDDGLLRVGKTYEWTITETRYPDLKKTPMNSFRLLTDSEFKSRQNELKELRTFYEKLGLSEAEIREAICLDYKICY